MVTNYYHILGIDEKASDSEIKTAFKKKALRYHPDKNAGDPNSEELFKQVNAAYQTLSNPYERARYDLKLRFGEVSIDRPPPTSYKSTRYERPRYSPRPIDHKTNDLATLWAFGLSLGVAFLVMTGMYVYNTYQDYQRDQMLGKRRVVFEKALSHHSSGQVASCLDLLESLGNFHREEEDIESFRSDVLDDILQNGTKKFYQEDYESALKDFELFEYYADNKRLSFQLLLAESHMMVGNYDESINRYNKMIIKGSNTIDNNLKIAWMFRVGKQDYPEAMKYYKLAGDLAVNSYRAIYGKAYPLILNPNNIPQEHFDVFHGMAITYFHLENYKRALGAIKWNTIMWPDYPENYVLKGRILETQGKYAEACEQYNLAVNKGWEESIACN